MSYPNAKIINVDAGYYQALQSNNLTCQTLVGRLQDETFINRVFDENTIDVVFHLAAQSHVDQSYVEPIQTCEDNIIGTITLLEACRKSNIKRFIYVSTDEVYGDSEDYHDEASEYQPNNPYSASKASAEMLCISYLRSYNLPLSIVRMSNVYGPRQYPEKLIPKFILTALRNESLPIHGSGEQKRTFLFITDAIEGIHMILNTGLVGEIYNITNEEEYSINNIAKMISDNVVYVSDRPYNDHQYHIRGDKLATLGFNPKVSFVQGLKMTREWYSSQCIENIWPSYVSPIRILIWGGNGWIGSQLVECLREVNIPVYLAESRYNVFSDVEEEIQRIRPSHIVSVAGRTYGHDKNNIDYLEDPKTIAQGLKDNLEGPFNLSKLADKYRLHYTYFGSGCCLNGGPYTEDDKPNFVGSVYSTTKGMVERLLPDSVLDLRIRMPISWRRSDRNLLDKLLTYPKILAYHQNSITCLDDILPLIVELICNSDTGIWNMTNPGTITNNEILELYKSIVDSNITWTNVDKVDTLAPRSNVVLDTNKLKKRFPNVPDVHTSVVTLMMKRAMNK
jgi:UDP-glucose 4,6-dehydratase